MKFLWGLLVGAFLGAIVTMWVINRQMADQQLIQQPTEVASQGLPDDFSAFLKRFGEDSLFQMQRTTFPLSGLPAYADSLTIANNNFKYTSQNWVLHKTFSATGNFRQEFQVASEGLVIERLVNKEGFATQRRFAKLGEEWHLIYYAALNKIY